MPGRDEREICARIVRARELAGLTQPELANLIGVTERTVRNYESGRVPWGLLNKIADVTGTTRTWLVDGPSQLDRIEAKIDQLTDRLLRPPDEDAPAHRLPKPPRPPDRQPPKASDGHPKTRRKAS